MSAFLESVAAWIVDYFAAATLVLAAALALRLLLRQPAARIAVAWCTCLGLAALALLTSLPSWPRIALEDVSPPWFAASADYPPHQPEANLAPVELPVETVALVQPIDVAPIEVSGQESILPVKLGQADITAFDLPWNHFAAGLWLGTVTLAIGWIVLGNWRTRGLLKAAVKAPDWAWNELKHIVERTGRRSTKGEAYSMRVMPGLWASRRVNSAVALGAWTPKIVLPDDSVSESNAPAVRAALAHEWAHICHGDLWLLAIERLLLPLLAVHPLFWWLRRSVRLDQELLADAAAAGDEPAEYAAALLVWARTAQPARHGLTALSMWEHPSSLSRRVTMILDPKHHIARPLSRAWAAIAVALAIPLILALSVFTLRPSTAQERPPETQAESAIPLRLITDAPSPAPQSVGQTLPVTQVQMDLLVMSINRDKLAAADMTLEDAIAQATESRCRKEAGLVVSEIRPEETVKLLEELKRHDAVQVISRPNVITLDGREANVHIGGEAPILRVEETINGKHDRRVEFKEFGTMLMVRPKLSGEKADVVTLDIVAEQSNLVPPGEKVVDGAVPRDVPGLVSHKFKLNSDVKLGGSLLVAESPADKKQLREAVKQQFLLIVTPQRAVRTVAAVYADPREGEKGEAARAATETALNAATAAEPEPGTAAAALLKVERDARAKETAELKRQVELLQQEVAKLQAATGTRLVLRTYQIRQRKADDVAADLRDLLREPLSNADMKLSVDATKNSVIIQAAEKHADEVGKIVSALDRPGTPIDPNKPEDALAQHLQKTLADRRRASEPAAAPGPQPPVTDPISPVHPGNPNWGLLTADVAEARLELERAEKEFARVEQLKAKKVISEEQFDQKRFELERAKIQLQRAESKLFAPAQVAQSTPMVERASVGQGTEIRLLELDLADAKLALDEAESDLQRGEQLRKQDAGSISEQEIRKYQFQAERAKIQVQRITIKLEAAKEPSRAGR